MSKLTNKIEANDRTIHEVLNEKKYTVDYFQREYSWGQKHIEQLVTDLATTFLNEYKDGDSRDKEAENYNNYYLGPFVVSNKEGKRSIIDGQQRLTSLTLFLIFLNHYQKELGVDEKIEEMIFSEHRGSRSFNIQVDERKACLDDLFLKGEYIVKSDDDASTINMAERYADISDAFPKDSFNLVSLPFFIDWLKYNVILVEIVAYSDDNAYIIFETMNDRGLNLTSTEMLKGYILSRFSDEKDRETANNQWKETIQNLRDYGKDEDQRFFQTWLRSQYALSIRASKAGSKNEDFEKIGTRFHSWVRENLSAMNLKADDSAGFVDLVNNDLKFFLAAYQTIKEAEKALTKGLEHIYYIQHWGIATSLSYPLMLAPLNKDDSDETVREKLNLVAKYIETFAVKRSVNFKNFGASAIRYTMYTLVKEIRNTTVEELTTILNEKTADMPEKWTAVSKFRLHGMNKHFVRFLLSRMTAYIENQAGMDTSFKVYFEKSKGKKPYEIEHIIADKFKRHLDEFEQEHEFSEYRNRIGGLILLPNGTNQSHNDSPYAEKLPHYLKENLLAQSLCEMTYEKNPNFIKMKDSLGLDFKAHNAFKKADMEARTELYQRICEEIWGMKDKSTELTLKSDITTKTGEK